MSRFFCFAQLKVIVNPGFSKMAICLLLIACANPVYSQFEDWNLEKEFEGIRMYSRDSTDRIKKFGCELVVEAKSDAALKLLRDVPNYNKWLHGLDTAILEESIDQNSFIYHVYIVKNFLFYTLKRDAVAKLQMSHSGTEIKRSSSRLHEAPLSPDYERLQHYMIDWTFIDRGDGSTRIIYKSSVDVQFPMAYFFLKGFIMESLETSFSNLRKQIANY